MVTIREYAAGDEYSIHSLIKTVYDEFVSTDYSDEGNNFFYDWIKPEHIANRQKEIINIWLAFESLELVGITEIRDNEYISLLFVSKQFHNHGIAKQLVEMAIKNILSREPKTEKIQVHASPYSIPVYTKIGFYPVGELKEEHGIWYMPMEMLILSTLDKEEPIPYNILLLADETVDGINQYLFKSDIYVHYKDKVIIAACVVEKIDSDSVEIMNIAVNKAYQGKGIGSHIIQHIIRLSKETNHKRVVIGTGDIAFRQIALYKKLGFEVFDVKENYFPNKYPEPIYENGLLLRDMIMLVYDLNKEVSGES